MGAQFDQSELTKLKNYASVFYVKAKQVLTSDVTDLQNVITLDDAKATFNKVIMRNDYRINGDRLLVCNKAGVEAFYGITPQDTLILVSVNVTKFNLSYFFIDDKLVRVSKGRLNKFTEVLTLATGFGWIYHQPQTFLPNVFLNQSGGFRTY